MLVSGSVVFFLFSPESLKSEVTGIVKCDLYACHIANPVTWPMAPSCTGQRLWLSFWVQLCNFLVAGRFQLPVGGCFADDFHPPRQVETKTGFGGHGCVTGWPLVKNEGPSTFVGMKLPSFPTGRAS